MELYTWIVNPTLVAAEILIALYVVLTLWRASSEHVSSSLLGATALASLCLANIFFSVYWATSPTPLSLLPHWRHLLLIFSGAAILLAEIVFNAVGGVTDSSHFCFGAILGYMLIHTVFFCTTLFPLRCIPNKSAQGIGIATFSFTISVTPPSSNASATATVPYEVPVQVWYAREPDVSSRPVTLWTSGDPETQEAESRALVSAILKNIKLPQFLLQHLALCQHPRIFHCSELAAGDLKLDGNAPIVIYSHGLYGWRQLASSTMEKLVNAGFVVLALDHCPTAYVSRPPGAAASYTAFNYYLPKDLEGQPQEKHFYNEGLVRRAAEVQALIDALLSVNEYGPNSNNVVVRNIQAIIDPRKVHLVGHSYGAGTVALVCSRDSRIASAVLLDSWMFPLMPEDLERGSLSASTLFLSASLWDLGKFQVPWRHTYSLASRARGFPSFVIKAMGAEHQNFSDIYLLCGAPLLAGMLGSVDPFEFTESYNSLILRFFQQRNELIGDSSNSGHATIAEDESSCISINFSCGGDELVNRIEGVGREKHSLRQLNNGGGMGEIEDGIAGCDAAVGGEVSRLAAYLGKEKDLSICDVYRDDLIEDRGEVVK